MASPKKKDREPQTVTYVGTAPKTVTIELHRPDGKVTWEERKVVVGDTIKVPEGVKRFRVSS